MYIRVCVPGMHAVHTCVPGMHAVHTCTPGICTVLRMLFLLCRQSDGCSALVTFFTQEWPPSTSVTLSANRWPRSSTEKDFTHLERLHLIFDNHCLHCMLVICFLLITFFKYSASKQMYDQCYFNITTCYYYISLLSISSKIKCIHHHQIDHCTFKF